MLLPELMRRRQRILRRSSERLWNSANNLRANELGEPDGEFLPNDNDLVELATAGADISDVAFPQTVLPDGWISFCTPLLLKLECSAVDRTATEIERFLSTFNAAFQAVPVHQHIAGGVIELPQ